MSVLNQNKKEDVFVDVLNYDELDNVKTFVGRKIITKEEALRNVNLRFYYLLQTFMRAGMMKSKGNDLMIKLYFHAIMGAYLKHYTVMKAGGATDLRVPIIWVQNSGSGKSQLNKYGIDVCNELGLSATIQTEFTTAGLIGTFDKDRYNYNLKHSLSPGEVKVTTHGGNITTKSYTKPITYGDMYYFDLIFIDEGKILFQGSKHTENVLSVLQPAMDYPGKIRKKLAAAEAIEYDCDCTLITSTVEFDNLGGEIMYQGFFQRCLFYSRKLSVYDYSRMMEELNRSEFDETKYKDLISDMGDLIERGPVPVIRDRHKIAVDSSSGSYINGVTQSWLRIIRDTLYGNDLKLAQSFVSRMNTFLYKIAGQMAVLNDKRHPSNPEVFIIGHEEIEYAIELINPLFENLTQNFTVKDTLQEKGLYNYAIALMQRMIRSGDNTFTKMQFVNYIMEIANTGRQRALRIYDNLISANFFNQRLVKAGTIHVEPNWNLWKTSMDGEKKKVKERELEDD
jgi:hypothetical protein